MTGASRSSRTQESGLTGRFDMTIREFIAARKFEIIFVLVICALIGLERIFPDKTGGGKSGPGNFGPIQVEYRFQGKDGMVPYEVTPPVPGPLWQPSETKTF